MDIPKRRFNLKKINEHLEKIEELRNDQNNKITEKTDPNKIKVPEFVKPKEEPTFVSKVKTKK